MTKINISSNNPESKSYKNLPSNYDISTWANKIESEKRAHLSIFNLKKLVNDSNQ